MVAKRGALHKMIVAILTMCRFKFVIKQQVV